MLQIVVMVYKETQLFLQIFSQIDYLLSQKKSQHNIILFK